MNIHRNELFDQTKTDEIEQMTSKANKGGNSKMPTVQPDNLNSLYIIRSLAHMRGEMTVMQDQLDGMKERLEAMATWHADIEDRVGEDLMDAA